MFWRLLAAVSILGLLACGSEDTAVLEQELAEARADLVRLEAQTSADDTQGQKVIEQARYRLRRVGDLLVEAEYDEARDTLKNIRGNIKKALQGEKTSVSVAKADALVVHGRAFSIGPSGEETALTGKESPKRLKRIATKLRSAVYLEPYDGMRMILGPEAEVIIREAGSPSARRFTLISGTLTITEENGTPFSLTIGALEQMITGPTNLEAKHQPLTKISQVCLYSGRAIHTRKGKEYQLVDMEAFRWTNEDVQKDSLSAEPRPIKPEKDAKLFTGTQEEIQVDFTWYDNGDTRLQVAEDPYFFNRVIDRNGLERAYTANLKPGKYFWRIRTMGKNRLPGPYAPVQRLVVSRGEGVNTKVTRDSQAPKKKVEGPDIKDVAWKVFKPTVLVEGKTDPSAKVVVNGEPAVVMDSGKFTVALNMEVSGLQLLRIEATNPNTGGVTEWEKEIRIP